MKLSITIIFLLLSAPMVFAQQRTEGPVFTSVTALLLPKDGMANFMTRWTEYLDGSKDKFHRSTEQLRDYVHFYVRRDGSLYLPDHAPWASLLKTFIDGEKKWSPGISSGRPHFQRIDIELSGINSSRQPLRYYIHTVHEKSHQENPIIYFASTLPSYPGTSAIVSAVYKDGKYQSTVAHHGTAAAVRVIGDYLKSIGKATKSGGSFEKSYFYTLK